MARQPDGDGWDWRHVRGVCLQAARRYAADPGDADDIAQEAATRAWRRRGSLEHGERREQWISTIARNEAFRMRARRPPVAGAEPDENLGADDPALERVVESTVLQAAIDSLSAPERRLLSLRYVDDMTQVAIAEALSLPEGTIKVKLHRARQKLRIALADR